MAGSFGWSEQLLIAGIVLQAPPPPMHVLGFLQPVFRIEYVVRLQQAQRLVLVAQ